MEDRQEEAVEGRGEGGLVTSAHLQSTPTGGTQENREPVRLGGGEKDMDPIFREERTFHIAGIL